MGCCETQNINPDKKVLIVLIEQAIQNNSPAKLAHLLKSASTESISIDESLLFHRENMLLSIPALAIFCGSLSVFQLLCRSFKISIEKINEIFEKYNTTATSQLCLNGHHKFLEYYLPLALEFDKAERTSSMTNTLNFSEVKEAAVKHSYTALQVACIKGHISCVDIIERYFKSKIPPWWLDFHFLDPVYGENCALLACKTGNYTMIKYLFKNTDSNFHILNTNHENALQVFLSAGKRMNIDDQLAVVRFLIEEVGIDITYKAEETLLICENYECACYIEEKLKDFNIFISKSDLEKGNEIEEGYESKPIKVNMNNSLGSTIKGHDQSYMNLSNVSKFL